MIVDTLGGLDTRNYTSASGDDRAFLIFWGLGGRLTTRLDNGKLGGGPLMGLGASYFRGRYGAVALATVGGMFGDGDAREGVAVRLQVGFEIEGGTSDWRLVSAPSRDCGGYLDASNIATNRTHFLFGLLPGVEYVGDGGGAAVSMSVSFREVVEPGVCSGLGP